MTSYPIRSIRWSLQTALLPLETRLHLPRFRRRPFALIFRTLFLAMVISAVPAQGQSSVEEQVTRPNWLFTSGAMPEKAVGLSVPSYAFLRDTSIVTERKLNAGKWAITGAVIGAATGLILYEIVDSQLDFGLCTEGSPGCEVERNYSRVGMALVLGAIGAAVGFAIGRSRSSSHFPSYQEGLRRWEFRTGGVPYPAEKPTLGVVYRLY